MHILQIQLEDNVKASILQPDGSYVKSDKRGKVLMNSQLEFCEEAADISKKRREQQNERVFIPEEHI